MSSLEKDNSLTSRWQRADELFQLHWYSLVAKQRKAQIMKMLEWARERLFLLEVKRRKTGTGYCLNLQPTSLPWLPVSLQHKAYRRQTHDRSPPRTLRVFMRILQIVHHSVWNLNTQYGEAWIGHNLIHGRNIFHPIVTFPCNLLISVIARESLRQFFIPVA